MTLGQFRTMILALVLGWYTVLSTLTTVLASIIRRHEVLQDLIFESGKVICLPDKVANFRLFKYIASIFFTALPVTVLITIFMHSLGIYFCPSHDFSLVATRC